MVLFLDLPLWKVNGLPYSEYWLPLGAGVLFGVTFLVAAKAVFGRHVHVSPPKPPAAPSQEYDPFAHGSPTEHRKSYRRTGHPVEVYYALPDKKDDPKLGWVFDRSVGGVGLVTAIEVAEGTILAVRPGNAPDLTPWIEVEVRSCRPSQAGSGFDLGCQFIRTPPWSVLLMFG